MSGFEGKEGAIQDLEGNWWYQDSMTASWFVWNGKEWMLIPEAAPRIVLPRIKTGSKPPIPWVWLLTFITSVVIAIIVVGGLSLVAYNFFPDYHIIPGEGDLNEILKMGGLGLFVTIFGFIMLKNSYRSFLPERRTKKDEWLKPSKKRGCGTLLNGIGQLFFGFLFLTGGLIMMTISFYQDVLPWLGF